MMVELLEKVLNQRIDFLLVKEKENDLKNVLESLLNELSEKEEAAIRYRYLPEDGVYHSDRDTADHFWISEDEINVVLQSAILKFRHPNRRQKLADIVLVNQNYKVTINNKSGGEDVFWTGFALFEEAYAKFLKAIESQPHGKLFKSVHLYHDDKLIFSET